MSRTTWSMSDEAAEKLESAASRKGHESANDFVLRVAEIVSENNNSTTVTKRNTQSEDKGGCECDVPEDVLTEAHLDDIQSIVDRRVEELEEQFR